MAVARTLGLRATDPVVLRDVSNLLVHLRPTPVVARVATSTATTRGHAVTLPSPCGCGDFTWPGG